MSLGILLYLLFVRIKIEEYIKHMMTDLIRIHQAVCLTIQGPSLLLDHRITESQNVQGWKGPLWVI